MTDNGRRERLIRRLSDKYDLARADVRLVIDLIDTVGVETLETLDPANEGTLRTMVDYADAETRGRVRLWKQDLVTHYRAILRARFTPERRAEIQAMYLKGSKGRQRAFAKLNKHLSPHASLQAVNLSEAPYALWLALKPRTNVLDDPNGQDCLMVNYVMAGRLLDGFGFAQGGWTLEVPDHALGRLLQRAPHSDPAAIVIDAHKLALQLDTRQLIVDGRVLDQRRFWLPAGPGMFCCSLLLGSDTSLGGQMAAYIRVHTWISNEMEVLGERPWQPGLGQRPHRLGDTWLLPAPWRQFVTNNEGSWVAVTHAPVSLDLDDLISGDQS
jgi:hypothetical protein